MILSAALVVICVLFFLFGGRTYIKRHYQTVHVDRAKETLTEKVDMNGKNGIIIYFTRVGNTNFKENVDAVSSASLMEENGILIGNSELLAEMLENATGYPSYAIRTKKKYSSSYGDTVSEAKKEMDENIPSELENDIPDLSEYDTVVLVYPLWWGTLPMPVQTFLSENDLEGKTVYSLVTHGGSGLKKLPLDGAVSL
ncbi:MAG: NAD(P)H-dependent oxidoreductase [Lachnospiraceae bacterium]|nr:NAD(P)H-dependent oxidoreductase [Lachnospiraceae bacterium]